VRILLAFVSELRMFCTVAVDSVFHLSSESLDQSLHWPSSGVTKCANRVTFNLIRKLLKHIDFSEVGIALFDSGKDIDHPAGTFSAWGALTTALVLVEMSKSKDSVDDVSLLVHDDDGSGSKTTLSVLEVIEIHKSIITLLLGQKLDG